MEIEACDAVGNQVRFCLGKVGQYDDGELVIHVSGDLGLEALPLAFVLNQTVTVLYFDEPAVAVMAGIPLSVPKGSHGPHLR